MITAEQIEALQINETASEESNGGTITVDRRRDTRTGKPTFKIIGSRIIPYLSGSEGAHSANGAIRCVKQYRHWLSGKK